MNDRDNTFDGDAKNPDATAILFPAQVTDSVQSGGTWYYQWIEQDFDPTTGAYSALTNGRAGTYDPTTGAGNCPTFELNNNAVATGTFVQLVLRGVVGGDLCYEFMACCGTTTTTTTAAPTTTTTTSAPCSGSCAWAYSHTTNVWSKSSSTCGTGCACFAPTFCPPASSTDACTTTACGAFGTDQTPPNCTGTTTTPGPSCTTTTTTNGPGCTAGCTWFCHPALGWLATANGCASSCPCSAPSTPCSSACAEATTPCVPPPPPPPPACTGNCQWVWVTPPGGPDYWYLLSNGCSGTGVTNCYCDPPAASGTVCAQQAATGCYVHGSSTGSPPCGTVTTTTTPGPGNCNSTCLWGSSTGANWDTLLRVCTGCACNPPLGSPTGTCSQAETPCTPLATTTPGPCGGSCQYCYCAYLCIGSSETNYNWIKSSDQCYPNNSGCGACSGPPGTVCGPGNNGQWAYIPCGYNPLNTTSTTTSTTTAAPATTTVAPATTTTAAPITTSTSTTSSTTTTSAPAPATSTATPIATPTTAPAITNTNGTSTTVTLPVNTNGIGALLVFTFGVTPPTPSGWTLLFNQPNADADWYLSAFVCGGTGSTSSFGSVNNVNVWSAYYDPNQTVLDASASTSASSSAPAIPSVTATGAADDWFGAWGIEYGSGTGIVTGFPSGFLCVSVATGGTGAGVLVTGYKSLAGSGATGTAALALAVSQSCAQGSVALK